MKLNEKNVIICKESLRIPLKFLQPVLNNAETVETIKNGKKHEI